MRDPHCFPAVGARVRAYVRMCMCVYVHVCVRAYVCVCVCAIVFSKRSAPLVMPSISRPEAPRLPSRAEVLNSRPATVLRDAWKQTTRTPVNPATGIPYG